MARIARIHPAIGVARLGTSEQPDGFFIGPEVPFVPVMPRDGFRDPTGALKRQGARFRVFLEDTDGTTRELTADDAEITWTIEVANRKAAADRFHGVAEKKDPAPRNKEFTPRDLLVLSAPKEALSGPDQSVDLINQTAFMGFNLPITLATAKTDDAGNLVVLAGFGKADSPNGTPLDSDGSNFANHDGWYDDTCDGRIGATIQMRDGSAPPTVLAAWLITAPPKFVPTVLPVVTLYDTLRQVAIDRGLLANPFSDPAFQPSFTRDILPILARARAVPWLWANGDPSPVASFHTSMATMPPTARNRIFTKLRTPGASPSEPGTGPGTMPRMFSDRYPDGTSATLTRLQYRMIEAWKNGTFVDDFRTAPPADATITPAGLDQAALDPCVGAAFYPGIEVSWKVRDEFRFVQAFRLDPDRIRPGDVTAQMSLPWQGDFDACTVESQPPGNPPLTWWPAQRPIDVRQQPDGPPVTWARAFDGAGEFGVKDMIKQWSRLGFVLPEGDALLEKDRVD